MSNFDKIEKVLREWYTPEQIQDIWSLLREYDRKNMAQPYDFETKQDKK